MRKTVNQKAWFFVLPVVALVAFNAIIPLMTVVNYSVQESFGENVFFWSGVQWFEEVLHSERFHAALLRQILFTAIVLVIEVPLGLAIALAMPRKGPWVSVCLVLMALPLLIPWNVVGAMWNILALPDIGLLGRGAQRPGHRSTTIPASRSPPGSPSSSWTSGTGRRWSCFSPMPASSRSPMPITRPPRSTARGRGRCSATSSCRSCKYVLTIAILLRFMDSFMIYTEVVVLTGGGPGNATTFLSIDLVKTALGQFDLGPAAAMSLIYFLIVLLLQLALLHADDAE